MSDIKYYSKTYTDPETGKSKTVNITKKPYHEGWLTTLGGWILVGIFFPPLLIIVIPIVIAGIIAKIRNK